MRLVIILFLMFTVTACARPTGDLGRARPSVLHDEILPTLGRLRALIFDEYVSNLNLTDEEREMHDRAWRFLIAPHANDWFFNVLVEWQRTRLTGYRDTTGGYDRYYDLLRKENYRSSRIRYNRLQRDIEADIATIPGVFRAICAVKKIDWQRGEAVYSVSSADSTLKAEVHARQRENEAYIAWFVRSARYRYDSYAFALERLVVETPHEQARRIDDRLGLYAIYARQAERGDFCGLKGVAVPDDTYQKRIPSRMERQQFKHEPEIRK